MLRYKNDEWLNQRWPEAEGQMLRQIRIEEICVDHNRRLFRESAHIFGRIHDSNEVLSTLKEELQRTQVTPGRV